MAPLFNIFSSRKRRKTAPLDQREYNILIISDLHMGEDITEFGSTELLEFIGTLNHNLGAFIDYHTDNREQDRPWLLIANGDTFDFLKLSLRPNPPQTDSEWMEQIVEQNRKAEATPEKMAWKIRRICEVHLPIMDAFARFIKAGNRLAFVGGNHDIEIYFPEVRVALQEFLCERYIQNQIATHQPEPNVEEQESFKDSISFHRWFIAQAGNYHIEHGHLYDEYCSLEFPLIPLDKAGSNQIAVPVGQKAMPYFVDLLSNFSTHNIDKLGSLGLLKMVFSKRLRLIYAIARTYLFASIDLISRTGSKRRKDLKTLTEAHNEELKDFARDTPYSFNDLMAIFKLKKTPVEYSIWRTITTFFLDRFIAGFLYISAIGITVILPLLWYQKVTVIVIASLLVFLYLLFSMKQRKQSTAQDLLQAAKSISRISGVKFVIMGHTHGPDLIPIFDPDVDKPTSYYVNTGSWVTRELIKGNAGQAQTFVVITPRGVQLQRWNNNEKSGEVLKQAPI